MRFVPLIPSDADPLPWRPLPAVELAWTGALNPLWKQGAPQVHALHLPASPWTAALGERVLAALRPRLDLDFLVIPAACPRDRIEHAEFMGTLEGLLEVTHGTGVKLALQPGPLEAEGLAKLLKEARGEAVGFCWDTHLPGDPAWVSDRLYCAVGQPQDDFAPLQRLGYRWNLALPAGDPDRFLAGLPHLEQAYPPVLFPADLTDDLTAGLTAAPISDRTPGAPAAPADPPPLPERP